MSYDGKMHCVAVGLSCQFAFALFEESAWAVKTPGGGFVLTRFLLPFHRLEKEEPVRLEDKKIEYKSIIFFFPQEYEVIPQGSDDIVVGILNFNEYPVMYPGYSLPSASADG